MRPLSVYLAICAGQWAQASKDMLTSLGGTLETNFTDPNAKKAPPKKKK